jgi:hypothetical protein
MAGSCTKQMSPAEATNWLEANLPNSFSKEMSRGVWEYGTRDVQTRDCTLQMTSSLTVRPPNGSPEPHVAHLTIQLGSLSLRETRALQGSSGTPIVLVKGNRSGAIVKESEGKTTQENEAPLFFEDADTARRAASVLQDLARSCGSS